jgi:putative tricarboxylic transport membrane protein
MARNGKPGKALGWTLLAALIGGLSSAVIMVALTKPIAQFALKFDAPDKFAIVLFGLASVVALGSGALPKALISLSIGLLIACVGTDETYGAVRFTFGLPILSDGIEFLVVMVGAYGVGEVLTRFEQGFPPPAIKAHVSGRTELPTFSEVRALQGVIFRSSLLGNLIGIVPGAGATIASFVSYGVEKQYGKRRLEMGSGVAEGIVAPQAAATASVGGALIPLLAIGIPGSGATAVILAAFMLHGVQPGPQVLITSALMINTIFASVFLGILIMCLIGYFAVRPLVKILEFPEVVVAAFVVIICSIGALAIRNNAIDLWLMLGFGLVGYLLEKWRFPIAPLVLGVILGPLAEESFINSMISFQNDWTIFFRRPIAGAVMAGTILTLLLPLLGRRKPAHPH